MLRKLIKFKVDIRETLQISLKTSREEFYYKLVEYMLRLSNNTIFGLLTSPALKEFTVVKIKKSLANK